MSGWSDEGAGDPRGRAGTAGERPQKPALGEPEVALSMSDMPVAVAEPPAQRVQSHMPEALPRRRKRLTPTK